ncbi:hypothetical protein NUU61_010172 [Penicillium alfredii]|uniref:Uncharacterized protein n=1 Tax=Penicillium alfredii TaxID=1506179 RepID=A0A9W9EHI0_9EURO|nr:uncharacterized protein NUU61_010172 [Penicillium alfredii]KAJ5081908.1 hypothetical protein NUU61_010172 [Penicillium alfredii]
MATTTNTKVDYTEKEVVSSAQSVSSASSERTLTDTNFSFSPSRTLAINARGIGAFRLPLPARQTEIFIHNPDDTVAYISTRDSLWSGDAVLSDPKRGNLIRTDYFFGPTRGPVLRLLQSPSVLADELKISGKWGSRAVQFMGSGGLLLEWGYAKEKRADGNKVNLIVLNVVDGQGKEPQNRRIAQLARGQDTRTPGTSRCAAGNGGELQIDEAARQSLEVDEAIVVATCLLMLKREIDRRRLVQCVVIAGGGGS